MLIMSIFINDCIEYWQKLRGNANQHVSTVESTIIVNVINLYDLLQIDRMYNGNDNNATVVNTLLKPISKNDTSAHVDPIQIVMVLSFK